MSLHLVLSLLPPYTGLSAIHWVHFEAASRSACLRIPASRSRASGHSLNATSSRKTLTGHCSNEFLAPLVLLTGLSPDEHLSSLESFALSHLRRASVLTRTSTLLTALLYSRPCYSTSISSRTTTAMELQTTTRLCPSQRQHRRTCSPRDNAQRPFHHPPRLDILVLTTSAYFNTCLAILCHLLTLTNIRTRFHRVFNNSVTNNFDNLLRPILYLLRLGFTSLKFLTSFLPQLTKKSTNKYLRHPTTVSTSRAFVSLSPFVPYLTFGTLFETLSNTLCPPSARVPSRIMLPCFSLQPCSCRYQVF